MKRILTLFLCLLCLLPLFSCGKKNTADTPEPLPVKTASSLLYNNGSTTLRFTYNDKWIWVDGPTFPLDDSTVTQIMEELPKLLALSPEKTGGDLSAYGFAESARYLTIAGEEGSQTVYFGAQKEDGRWYMRLADGNAVFLIPDDFMSLLQKNIYDMAILPALPELTEDIVTFIGISQSEENNTYLLQTDGVWKTNGTDVSTTAKKILKELGGMELTRCVDYFPAGGVPELCGLGDGATTVTVKYLNSVDTESELVLKIGGETETGGEVYVTVGENDAIYYLPKKNFTTVLSLLKTTT